MNKLHFKGDHRKFVPNRIVGPDNFGAWYIPVTAHYFDGVTTIFYRPVPPDKLPPHCHATSKLIVQQQVRLKGGTQQWPSENASSQKPRSASSSLEYQVSRRSGGRKKTGASGDSGQKRSQQELLSRFRKPGSR